MVVSSAIHLFCLVIEKTFLRDCDKQNIHYPLLAHLP